MERWTLMGDSRHRIGRSDCGPPSFDQKTINARSMMRRIGKKDRLRRGTAVKNSVSRGAFQRLGAI
jgi:hypothetical protein